MWWSKGWGIPATSYASWLETLAAAPGRPARILAWTATIDGLIVLSPAVLSVSTDQGWQHVGWHEIEHGGWNAETEQLRWQVYDSARVTVTLPDPARVPEVFEERIKASIVFERFVPVGSSTTRGVVVNGRRDLADRLDPISWHASLSRGLTWRTPGVQETAEAAVEELRREYDPGWSGC
ncbi:MAG: hypothetical protein L0H41_06305 [Microlunatus sp.]|nr:hypothetical protein [Microlunatus sp.]